MVEALFDCYLDPPPQFLHGGDAGNLMGLFAELAHNCSLCIRLNIIFMMRINPRMNHQNRSLINILLRNYHWLLLTHRFHPFKTEISTIINVLSFWNWENYQQHSFCWCSQSCPLKYNFYGWNCSFSWSSKAAF